MGLGKWLDKNVGDRLREWQGTRRCDTFEKLCAYMRGKGLVDLEFWVEARMWYVADRAPADEWTPIEQVLARDVRGNEIQTDCEERCVVKKNVVNKLNWGFADNLCVYGPSPVDGKETGHAICVVWQTGKISVMDYELTEFPSTTAVCDIIKKCWPWATEWCFRNDQGELTSGGMQKI